MSEIDTEEDISMNKTQLKNFAVAARVALIERVKDRARGLRQSLKTFMPKLDDCPALRYYNKVIALQTTL